MKTKNINYTQKLLAVLIIAVGLVSIAWLNPTSAKQPAVKRVVTASIAPAIVPASIRIPVIDTVPAAKKQHAEKVQAEELDAAAKAGLEAANEAMKDIDWSKMNADVAEAMKNVDWDKMNAEYMAAMKNINWDEMSKNTAAAMKNINMNMVTPVYVGGKLVFDGKSMFDGKILFDTAAMRQGMIIGMEGAKTVMANMSAQNTQKIVAEAMASAQKGMAEARVATTDQSQNKYNSVIKQMSEDKLIDKAKGFTIQKKGDVLSINGKEQPKAITDKYSKMLGDNQNISILGKDDNLTITIDSDTDIDNN